MLSWIKDELRPKIGNKIIKLKENNTQGHFYAHADRAQGALNISRKNTAKNKY